MTCEPFSWKRTLSFIWISQFIAMMSFSFGLPFVAFFMQEDLGVKPESEELALYIALFGAATPLAMTVFAPVWGALADKYGRRLMLLRAYAGGLIVLTLMGAVTAPWMLIVLRLFQGALSGSVSASQSLVSSSTPDSRSGFALGALNSAVFSGSFAGAFFGGITAERYGYRAAFFVSGVLMLMSFLLVLLGVRESFVRPEASKRKSLWSLVKVDKKQLAVCLPILALMTGVMFVRQFDSSYLALFVQELHGSLEGVSAVSGMLFAICGLAGVVSGFIMGLLADRYSPDRIAVFSAFAAAAFSLPLAFVETSGGLFALRFAMVFMGGGLEPVLQIWLCKKTPAANRGLIFGWAASARSMGWMFAPLAGGVFYNYIGVRSIFVAESVLFLLIIIGITRAAARLACSSKDAEELNTDIKIAKIDSITVGGIK